MISSSVQLISRRLKCTSETTKLLKKVLEQLEAINLKHIAGIGKSRSIEKVL